MKILLPLPLIAVGLSLSLLQSPCGAQDSSTSAFSLSEIRSEGSGPGEFPAGFKTPDVSFNGIVVDPQGSPVEGVTVYIADEPAILLMSGNEFPRRRGFPSGEIHIAHTGKNGEFSVALSPGKKTVYASAESGCALLTSQEVAEAPLRIALVRWALVKIASSGHSEVDPLAVRAIYLWADQSVAGAAPMIERVYEGVLDNDAAFTFARVIPGAYRIDRRKVALTGTGFYGKTYVKSGETLEIVIGGGGHAVAGRVQVPETVAGQVDWQHSVVWLHPANSDSQSAENPIDTHVAAVEPGRVRAEAAIPETYHTCVTMERDFRLDDVKPGAYLLTIQLRKQGAKASSGGPVFVGELKQEIVVAPVTSLNADLPVDLGVFQMAE